MVLLPEDQQPFGADCTLSREVQSVAFHHSLTAANVAQLAEMEFTDVASFAASNPGLGPEELNCYNLVVATFPSPVARCRVTLALRRLHSADILAELPRDSAGGPSSAKKAKVSDDGAAAPSGSAAAAGAAAAAPVAPPGGSSTSTEKKDSSTSDSSSSDSSEDDQGPKTDKADKDKKGDKPPKDAAAMVEELGSEVRFWSMVLVGGRLSALFALLTL